MCDVSRTGSSAGEAQPERTLTSTASPSTPRAPRWTTSPAKELELTTAIHAAFDLDLT